MYTCFEFYNILESTHHLHKIYLICKSFTTEEHFQRFTVPTAGSVYRFTSSCHLPRKFSSLLIDFVTGDRASSAANDFSWDEGLQMADKIIWMLRVKFDAECWRVCGLIDCNWALLPSDWWHEASHRRKRHKSTNGNLMNGFRRKNVI